MGCNDDGRWGFLGDSTCRGRSTRPSACNCTHRRRNAQHVRANSTHHASSAALRRVAPQGGGTLVQLERLGVVRLDVRQTDRVRHSLQVAVWSFVSTQMTPRVPVIRSPAELPTAVHKTNMGHTTDDRHSRGAYRAAGAEVRFVAVYQVVQRAGVILRGRTLEPRDRQLLVLHRWATPTRSAVSALQYTHYSTASGCRRAIPEGRKRLAQP